MRRDMRRGGREGGRVRVKSWRGNPGREAMETDTRLNRRKVAAALLEGRGDLLTVAGLGAPAWDVAAAGDHPLNFYLWGAMGQAAMVGLGLALARPDRRVLVLTGDGEALMGVGALATIGVQAPENLTVVVVDNGCYGETGMQASHTAFGVDLAGMARSCGFPWSSRVTRTNEVADLRDAIHTASGPGLAVVEISTKKPPLVLPPKEGTFLKDRFRGALLGRGG